MAKLATTAFDPAEHLRTPRAMAAFLDEAMAGGDIAEITSALGVIARARGMTELARETGVKRESLYRALGADGNPELATLLKVVKALGLRLTAKAV
jgi:probable addiction module antidote protein